jgi:hypothetical protein
MRQQRSNSRTFSPEPAYHDGDLTVEQALALGAEQARLAAHYADRVEQAQAAAEYGAMRQWSSDLESAATLAGAVVLCNYLREDGSPRGALGARGQT